MIEHGIARNALYLMGSTFVSAAAGFLFWSFCSHLFTPHEVGLATTLVAATALVSALSMAGLNNAVIAYIPKHKTPAETTALMDTAVGTVGVISLLAGLVYVIVANHIDRHLPGYMPALWQQALVVLYIAAQSLSTLTDSMLTALRQPRLIFVKNNVGSVVKLVLPFICAGLAGFGIFTAIAIVTFVSLAVSIYNMRQLGYRPRPEIVRHQLSAVRRFTLDNYVGTIFGMLPATLVPLLISWILGATQVAYLYIALTISQLLNVIPAATSQSFFAEASHGRIPLPALVRRAVSHIYILLVPAVGIVLAGGGLLLKIFGGSYAHNGLHALQLLSIASLFGVVNYLGDTYLNVKHRTRAYIAMNALNAALVVVLAGIGAHRHGLTGAATGWLMGQAITNVAYAGLLYHYWRQGLAAQQAAYSNNPLAAAD